MSITPKDADPGSSPIQDLVHPFMHASYIAILAVHAVHCPCMCTCWQDPTCWGFDGATGIAVRLACTPAQHEASDMGLQSSSGSYRHACCGPGHGVTVQRAWSLWQFKSIEGVMQQLLPVVKG